MTRQFSDFPYSEFSFFPVYVAEKKLAKLFPNAPKRYFKNNLSLFKKDFVNAETKSEFTIEISKSDYEKEPEDNRLVQINFDLWKDVTVLKATKIIFSHLDYDCSIFREAFSEYYSAIDSGNRELFLNEFLKEFRFDLKQLHKISTKDLNKIHRIFVEYFVKIYELRWQELLDTYKNISGVVKSMEIEISSQLSNFSTIEKVNFRINEKLESTQYFALMELIAKGELSYEPYHQYNYKGEKFKPPKLSKELALVGIKIQPSYLYDTLTESDMENSKNVFLNRNRMNIFRHNYLVTKFENHSHNLSEFYKEKSQNLKN